jgi:hypothetical protein
MNRPTPIILGFALGLLLGRSDGFCAGTNAAPGLPPLPPPAIMRSPVDAFRSLLVLPAADRKAQLAARPPEVRQRLLDKIREYQSLTPEARDLRLKATELQWYLKPLMTASPTNRTAQLETIPENMREMVAVRLKQWDAFPPGIQSLMLTNQAGPEYFVSGSRPDFPPLPQGLVHSRVLERYNRLFELTAAEQEKVLATLSEAEKRQMQKTLQAYERLTPQQRAQCVLLFAKFSELSSTERQEFLKNAERWAQMTPAQRQSWRELVSTAPNIPPLPQLTIKRPPPFPPGLRKTPNAPTTNGG